MSAVCLLMGYKSVRGEFENSSQYVAQALDGEHVGDAVVRTVLLPPDSHAVGDAIAAAIEEYEPAVAIALGRARIATGLQVERTAVNVLDFPAPDTKGQTWVGSPVTTGGPAAYFATIPVKAMVAAIREAGVPARLSNSASTHMCNQAMYTVLHLIATRELRSRGGFVHVPNLPQHIAKLREWGPSMALETQALGLRAALTAATEAAADINASVQPWEW